MLALSKVTVSRLYEEARLHGKKQKKKEKRGKKKKENAKKKRQK
jgi:hypothetical protein